MRKSFLFILSVIFAETMFVSCNEDKALEWSPSMIDNTEHPFDAGRFIQMCYYNERTDSDSEDFSTDVCSISSIDDEIGFYDNIALISPDTLYLRSNYLNQRTDYGYNTFIAAQTIIPVFEREAADNDTLIEEYYGEPIQSFRGSKFSFDDFLAQAATQTFPQADITTYPKTPSIQMPAIFCSRTLSGESLLDELAIAAAPVYTEVMMAGNLDTLAVRYTFNDSTHLTILSSPLLLSNYSMSYENAQIAPRVMNLMRYAFTSEIHPDNQLPHIFFFLEGDSKTNYTNYYTADRDPSKKSGRPFFTSIDLDDQDDNSSLWIIVMMLLVFLPLIFPYRRRPIPVYDGYKNRSAQYAKHVGVMYSDEGNLKLILDNRISYFYYGVKSKYGVDLSDSARLLENASILASHWRREVDEVTVFLRRLKDVRNSSEKYEVSKEQLAQLCEQMNLYTNL